MKCIRTLLLIVMVAGILYSCKKEYSFEGKLPITAPVSTTDNTCQVRGLIQSDISTGIAEYAYNSTYNADHKVSLIELVDSANNSVDNSFPVSYSSGKIQVGSNQYFITDSSGKVTEFHGYEFPEDSTSERFNVKYTYNASGQLIKREEQYDLFPGITSFQMDYSYTDSNLTRAVIKVNTGAALQEFIDVTYEYENSTKIKNFINLDPVAPEIFYFQTAINAGISSVNPVTKVTTLFKNYNNGQDSTTVSNFVHYTYDTKHQVTSFQLTGSDLTLNNLYADKKYNFNYSCY